LAPRDHRPRGPTASAQAVGLRLIRRAGAAAILAATWVAAPASALRLGPETPHSPNAEDISTSYWVMLAVTVVVVVVVNLALIAALLRFRERRGRAPAQITAGRGVVGRLAVALAVVATAVFVFGIVMSDSARTLEESGPNGLQASVARTAQVSVKGVSAAASQAAEEAALSEEPPGGDAAVFIPPQGAPLEIDAIAQQWLWRFEYPGGTPGHRTFSYGELVVPVDTAVVLNIDSTDVIHSWWVPSLGGQVQAVPGSLARTWFKADEVGVYEGRGTVFDGTSYPSFRAQVRVVDPAEYQAYVEGLAGDIAEAQAIVQDEIAAQAEAQAAAEEAPTP
jgi:cytochrome c oxidase subunit II